MVLTNKFLLLAFLLLLLYLVKVMPHASAECNSGEGCFYSRAVSFGSRKVLHHLESEKVVSESTDVNEPASSINGKGGSLVDWDELRKAPSGPDPLHHNGGGPGPMKPRTP